MLEPVGFKIVASIRTHSRWLMKPEHPAAEGETVLSHHRVTAPQLLQAVKKRKKKKKLF